MLLSMLYAMWILKTKKRKKNCYFALPPLMEYRLNSIMYWIWKVRRSVFEINYIHDTYSCKSSCAWDNIYLINIITGPNSVFFFDDDVESDLCFFLIIKTHHALN